MKLAVAGICLCMVVPSLQAQAADHRSPDAATLEQLALSGFPFPQVKTKLIAMLREGRISANSTSRSKSMPLWASTFVDPLARQPPRQVLRLLSGIQHQIGGADELSHAVAGSILEDQPLANEAAALHLCDAERIAEDAAAFSWCGVLAARSSLRHYVLPLAADNLSGVHGGAMAAAAGALCSRRGSGRSCEAI